MNGRRRSQPGTAPELERLRAWIASHCREAWIEGNEVHFPTELVHTGGRIETVIDRAATYQQARALLGY